MTSTASVPSHNAASSSASSSHQALPLTPSTSKRQDSISRTSLDAVARQSRIPTPLGNTSHFSPPAQARQVSTPSQHIRPKSATTAVSPFKATGALGLRRSSSTTSSRASFLPPGPPPPTYAPPPPPRISKTPPPTSRRLTSVLVHTRSASSSIVFPSAPADSEQLHHQQSPQKRATTADGNSNTSFSIARPARPPRSRSRNTSTSSINDSPVTNSARLQREAQEMVETLPQLLSNAIRIAQQKIGNENNSTSMRTPIKDRRFRLQSGPASPAIIAHSPSFDNATVILGSQPELNITADTMLEDSLGGSKLDPMYSPSADVSASTRTSLISTHTATSTTASATASESTHQTSSAMSSGTTAPEPNSNWTSPIKSPTSLPVQLAITAYSQARSRADGLKAQSPASIDSTALEEHEASSSSGSAMEYMNTVRSSRPTATYSLPSDPNVGTYALLARKHQLAAQTQNQAGDDVTRYHRRTESEPSYGDPSIRPGSVVAGGLVVGSQQRSNLGSSSPLAAGLGLDLVAVSNTSSVSLIGGLAAKVRSQTGTGTDGTTSVGGTTNASSFVSAAPSPAMPVTELFHPQQHHQDEGHDFPNSPSDAEGGLTREHVRALPASRRPSLGGLRRWLSSSELAGTLPSSRSASDSIAIADRTQGADPSRLTSSGVQLPERTMFDPHWYTSTTLFSNPRYRADRSPAVDGSESPAKDQYSSHRRAVTALESSSSRGNGQLDLSKSPMGEDGTNSAFASVGHPTPVVPAFSNGWENTALPPAVPVSPTSPVVSEAMSGLVHGSQDLVRSASYDPRRGRTPSMKVSQTSLRARALQQSNSLSGHGGIAKRRLPRHQPSLSLSSVDVPQRSSSRKSNEPFGSPGVHVENGLEEMAKNGHSLGAGAKGVPEGSVTHSPRPISDPHGGDTSRLLLYGRNDGSVPSYLDTHLPMLANQLRIVDISGCGLTELPASVAQCTGLTELNISANRIGTIPSFVGDFKQLQVFQADFCELVYLPYALHELSECLLVLSVRGNKLTHVPSWLHLLSSLERLNYEGNPLQAQWRSVLDPLMRATLIPPASAGVPFESPNADSSSSTILARLDGLPVGSSTATSGLPSRFSFSSFTSVPALQSAFGGDAASKKRSPPGLPPQGPISGLPTTPGHGFRLNALHERTVSSPQSLSAVAPTARTHSAPGLGSNLLGAPFQPTTTVSRSSSLHRHLDEEEEEEEEEVLSNHETGATSSTAALSIPTSASMVSFNSAHSPFATSMDSNHGDQEQPATASSNDFLDTDPAAGKGSRWKFFRKSGRKLSTSGTKDFLPSASSQGEELGGLSRPKSARKLSSRPNTSNGVLTSTAKVASDSTTSFGTLPSSPTMTTAGFEPETPASIASTSSFFGVRRLRKNSTPYADMTGSTDASNFTKSSHGLFPSSSTTRTPLASMGPASPLPEALHKFSPMSPFPSVDSQRRIAAARAIVEAQKTSLSTVGIVSRDDDEGSVLDYMSHDNPDTSAGSINLAPSTLFMGAIPNTTGLVVRPVELWPEHFIRLRALMYYLRDLDELGPERVESPVLPDRQQEGDPSKFGSPPPSASDAESTTTAASSKTAPNYSRPTSSVASVDSLVSDFKAEVEPTYKDSASLRSRIISEIVSTEETYVGLLGELVEIYVRTARRPVDGSSNPPVPPGEQRAVFGNVDALLSFHQGAFLPALKYATEPLTLVKGAEQDPDVTARVAEDVAEVFTRHAAFLRAYVPYVNGAEDAQSRIMTWRTGSGNNSHHSSRTNSPFFKPFANSPDATGTELSTSQRKKAGAFLKRCREHPKHSQLSLESYLLLPVQRIPRYRLLLEQLRKSTPPTRLKDPMATTRALELVATMASSVNESKRQSEQDRRLLQWQNRIRGKWPSPLVQPHRRFVREGQLVLKRVVKRETAFGVEDVGASMWPMEEMCLDNAVTIRGDGATVTVDYLHQQSLSRTITVLLCNDLIALVTPAEGDRLFGGHDARELVDLYGVLHLHFARAVKVVAGNSIRVVDSRSVLYFACKDQQEAESWAGSMNAARLSLKRS
ncbi:hypothetical protein CF336_g518 [Tilletia laevis]|uniref:Uncharacterized protein n=3 Tax=Tilletia TaxID=13289 RepID=A0A177VI72_9BASI|nr:hypothetical protein CF336_g518 [Tilletia laevis]KAE8259431.1 hypothetical protein A4X03_0g4099 [Tilletia caries]